VCKKILFGESLPQVLCVGSVAGLLHTHHEQDSNADTRGGLKSYLDGFGGSYSHDIRKKPLYLCYSKAVLSCI